MSNKHFEQNENSSEKENQEVVTEETTNLQEEKANLSEKVDEAVLDIVDKIDQIGTVTFEDEDLINEIDRLYNKLSDEQKNDVINYDDYKEAVLALEILYSSNEYGFPLALRLLSLERSFAIERWPVISFSFFISSLNFLITSSSDHSL